MVVSNSLKFIPRSQKTSTFISGKERCT